MKKHLAIEWALIFFHFVGSAAIGVAPSWMIVPAPYYSPETDFGAHVSAICIFGEEGHVARTPSHVTLSANYTQKNQFSVFLLPNFYFDEGKYALKVFSAFQIYPNTFYGIGNDTQSLGAESYSSQIFWTRARLLRSLSSGWSLGPVFEYENHQIVKSEAGGQIAQGRIPGGQGAAFLGGGLALEYDTRDHSFSPTQGRFGELSALVFPRLHSPDFSFQRLLLDARQYVSLGVGHVLALQGLAVISLGNPAFQAMPKLGGDRLLRGIFFGRYQDRNLAAVQTEYRFPIWRRLSGVGFAGVGKVAPSLGELGTFGVRPSGGVGLRFLALEKERLNVRVDLAAGTDSRGVYFSFGEAF